VSARGRILGLQAGEYVNTDEEYIRRAMDLAAVAEKAGDVPIGAVFVCGDVVLEAKNEKESRPDATAHAEMLLLQGAARRLGAWRSSTARTNARPNEPVPPVTKTDLPFKIEVIF